MDSETITGLLQASGSALALSARGFGPFALYFAVMVAFVAIHMSIYMKVTRHDEMKLIRDGNAAASLATIGTMIGLAVPLYSVVSYTGFLLETVMWAVVALLIQLAAYFAAGRLLGNLSHRIERNELSAGIWIAGVSLTAGILQAVCMKP